MSTDTTPESAIQKYKTLARAVLANDLPACREIHVVLKEQGKDLDADEVNALGLRWFLNKKGRSADLLPFLNDLGFNFKQVIVLDQQNENVGTAIPFRLIGSDQDEELLVRLLQDKIVPVDICDGIGDNLLVESLSRDRFDFSSRLVSLGVNINETNLAGQAPLHVFASRLSFRAVQWLCENNADPTIEDLTGSRPSELVPDVMQGWNPQCMFDVLEDYVEAYQQNKSFVSNAEYEEMVVKEKGPEAGEDDDQTYGDQAAAAKSMLSQLGIK